METEKVETEKVETEKWEHILINGKSKQLEVKNPQYRDWVFLNSIDGFRPAPLQINGKEFEPTPEYANAEKRRIYTDFFKKPFKNLAVLTGAGSSLGFGGLLMSQLWTKAEERFKIDGIDGFSIIQEKVKYKTEMKNLEVLLSRIDGYNKFDENAKVTIGTTDKKLIEIRNELFQLIKVCCTIKKPTGEFAHKIFLEKLLQRKQTSPRVKIFTLNYDLLFEYAATEVNAVVIDGFSYTIPRTFSGRFFDYDIVQREGSKLQEEDNFIQRVFHLHKLHGSINWERDETDKMVRIKEAPENPLMVYPRDAKYEDSYEQPFFEMMARFQRNLRQNNDTMLICIGYSFNDKHINAAIEEALNQNPGFRLAIIDPGFAKETASQSLKTIKDKALETERILLVAETFSEFAMHFPEIMTYQNDQYVTINLNNEQ